MYRRTLATSVSPSCKGMVSSLYGPARSYARFFSAQISNSVLRKPSTSFNSYSSFSSLLYSRRQTARSFSLWPSSRDKSSASSAQSDLDASPVSSEFVSDPLPQEHPASHSTSTVTVPPSPFAPDPETPPSSFATATEPSLAGTAEESSPVSPSNTSSSSSLDAVAEPGTAEVASVPDTFGYLHSLGLDYGIGPSTLVQNLLEGVHVLTGLPWWASIVVAALGVRLVMFPTALGSSDMAMKLAAIQPEMQRVRESVIAQVRAQNERGLQQAQAEMQQLHQVHDIKPWKGLLPMLQAPLAFGFFRVIKGMSVLPVPGVENESVAWITDVTVHDPFFVLPLATSALLYLSLKKGAESGTTNIFKSPQGKILLYGFPAITMCVTAFWPSMLQLYFASTALFGVVQVYLLQNQTFRRMVNIAPMVTRPKSPLSKRSPADVEIVDWVTPSEVKNASEQQEQQKKDHTQEQDNDKKP